MPYHANTPRPGRTGRFQAHVRAVGRHLLGLGLIVAAGALPSPAAPEPTAPTPLLVVPLRVHLLTTPIPSPLHTTLTPADFERFLHDINRIWRPAGIRFELESCLVEPAAPGPVPVHPAKGSFTWLLPHLPQDTRATRAFNLYCVHQFSVNGVYLPQGLVIRDIPTLRRVPGGFDQALPRVIAHELGHALSLLHRQKFTNLMASGTTGFSLNETEIRQARHAASQRTWIQSSP